MTMPMPPKHWIAALLAALATITTGLAAAAPVVTMTDHRVLIEVGNALVPTITVNPVFASNTVGNSFASADLLTGTFKVSTFVTGPDSQLARSSGFVSFRNDGTDPLTDSLTFMFGDISGSLSATFAHTIGADPLGGFGNQLSSSLFVGPTFSSAGVTYQHGVDTFIVQQADVTLGAMTVINTGTTSTLNVDFFMDGFTVVPGGIFDLQIAHLNAFVLASVGYGALVNASNTFQVSMVLPAGVTLDSPIPLAWVTTATAVPEPATYALILGGLGFMTWVTKRRRKSA